MWIFQVEAGRLGAGRLGAGTWNADSYHSSFCFINSNTSWGVIICISRTHMQEFIIFMTTTSISVIKRYFHQQNTYLIRILCMNPAPSSVTYIMIFFQ